MSLLRDVHALGRGAVPRAAYEASKRIGTHSLLFNTVRAGFPVRSRFLLCLPSSDSASARACLADADQIVDEGVLAFGRRVPLRTAQDWIADPESGRVWPQQAWWEIDIRSDHRLGDVKWVWEIGRHRDLVVLARAAALGTEGAPWAAHLDRLIRWWCDANPLERSVHWYSNLELSLRLVAWNQIIGLAGHHLPIRTLDLMALHIAQMRRHLWRDLPYTMSSMRNNHLLGDALGMGLADSLTGQASGRIRGAVARRIWQAQLARQMNPDGSMIEDSLSYHRFVLEMLCARHLAGDRAQALVDQIGRASRYLADLGALDGPMPPFGDWDEGRVLASSRDPLDVGNAVALGLAIAGEPERSDWREKYDLLDWYLPPSAPGALTGSRPGLTASKAGDVVVAQRGDWQVWLKCGSAPSHGHADLGHVSARYRDAWVLNDPGTGTYNGPLRVRNGFRVSRAHNVLRPLGLGQMEPHRAFRWLSRPLGRAGRVQELGSATVLWGAHDAYVRRDKSPWPWRLARVCVVHAKGITVIDWREGGAQEFELTVPFHPDCRVDGSLVWIGNERMRCEFPGDSRVAIGEDEPFLGWASRSYGSWEPAPWVVCQGAGSGPVAWTLGDLDVAVDKCVVAVSELTLEVTWSDDRIELIVEAGGRHIVDALPIGHQW